MPLYACICTNCAKEFEALLHSWKITPVCPDCNANAFKLPSAPAVQFRGGGWAADGYSKGGK